MDWVSLLVSIAGVGVAVYIAWRQNAQAIKQSDTLNEVKDLSSEVRDLSAETSKLIAELLARQIVEDPTGDNGPDASPDTATPANASDLADRLREAGARLRWEDLVWRKKTTVPPRRGNLGWFVYSDEHGERWFVHSGRVVTARRAVPMDRLRAWEATVDGAKPEDIRIDYQVSTGRGSHSWYVETYDGRTWRLSKGGQGKQGITVTEVVSAD